MIYRCPVCGGRGLVPAGFYNIGVFGGGSTTATSETCRACGGSGLVADCWPSSSEWKRWIPPSMPYEGGGTA